MQSTRGVILGLPLLAAAVGLMACGGSDGGNQDDNPVEPSVNTPPTAQIVSPIEGSTFEAEFITFEGSAEDPEDGSLTGSRLTWISSRDGELGGGERISRETLSFGTHTIRLVATDRGEPALTDTASVTIEVIDTPALWVAVGDGDKAIATSVDGITWRARETPFTKPQFVNVSQSANGVSFNGSMWVAVGGVDVAIATSPDGRNWTARTSPFAGQGASAVAWNGSMWVAVGDGTTAIATSGNATTWVSQASPFERANGIAWNGSLWVAVGTGSTAISTSPDGNNWTAQTSPFDEASHVAWNGAIWVAAGEGASQIATSPDGVTWSGRASPFKDNGIGVAWNGALWVVTGGGSPGPKIATSADGITWTAQTPSAISDWAADVAWDGSKWVAVGCCLGEIATSEDGMRWTARRSPFSAATRGVAAAVPLFPPP